MISQLPFVPLSNSWRFEGYHWETAVVTVLHGELTVWQSWSRLFVRCIIGLLGMICGWKCQVIELPRPNNNISIDNLVSAYRFITVHVFLSENIIFTGYKDVWNNKVRLGNFVERYDTFTDNILFTIHKRYCTYRVKLACTLGSAYVPGFVELYQVLFLQNKETTKWKGNRRLQTCQILTTSWKIPSTGKWLETKHISKRGGGALYHWQHWCRCRKIQSERHLISPVSSEFLTYLKISSSCSTYWLYFGFCFLSVAQVLREL